MAALPNTLGNCGSCVHYLTEKKSDKQGVCRRYPPHVFLIGMNGNTNPPTPISQTMWPMVLAGHGCGEYRQKGGDA